MKRKKKIPKPFIVLFGILTQIFYFNPFWQSLPNDIFPDSQTPSIRTDSHSQLFRAAVSGDGGFWHKSFCTHSSLFNVVSGLFLHQRDGTDVDDAFNHTMPFVYAVQSLLVLPNPRSDIIHLSSSICFQMGLPCPKAMIDSVCLFSCTDIAVFDRVLIQILACSTPQYIQSQAELSSLCFETH